MKSAARDQPIGLFEERGETSEYLTLAAFIGHAEKDLRIISPEELYSALEHEHRLVSRQPNRHSIPRLLAVALFLMSVLLGASGQASNAGTVLQESPAESSQQAGLAE